MPVGVKWGALGCGSGPYATGAHRTGPHGKGKRESYGRVQEPDPLVDHRLPSTSPLGVGLARKSTGGLHCSRPGPHCPCTSGIGKDVPGARSEQQGTEPTAPGGCSPLEPGSAERRQDGYLGLVAQALGCSSPALNSLDLYL